MAKVVKYAERKKKLNENVLKHTILKKVLLRVKKEFDYHSILEIDQVDDKGRIVKISRDLFAIGQCRLMKLVFENTEEKYAIASNGHEFYCFTGTHYEEINPADMVVFIRYFAHKSGVYHLYADDYKYHLEVFNNAKNFFILPGSENDESKRFLNLENGTLEINQNPTTGKDGKLDLKSLIKLKPHEYTDFLKYCNNYNFNEAIIKEENYKPNCPKWEEFLRQIIKKASPVGNEVTTESAVNEENIKALQEAFGYVFYSGSNPPKIFVFAGDGNNGKSVVNQIAHNIFGFNNTTSYTTGELSSESVRAKIVGKLLNYPSENEENGQVPAILKAMASREKISYRPLFRNPEQSANWPRIFINQNSENKIVERAHGFWRRFYVIDFLVNITKDQENKDLANEIIKEELPEILNWSLLGLKRFYEQGRIFTESKASSESIEKWKTSGDAVRLFIEEFNLIPGIYGEAQNEVEYKYLWQTFFNWQKISGFKALNKTTFKTRLIKDLKIPYGKIKGTNKNAFYIACTNHNGQSEIEGEWNGKIIEKFNLPIINQSEQDQEPTNQQAQTQNSDLPF